MTATLSTLHVALVSPATEQCPLHGVGVMLDDHQEGGRIVHTVMDDHGQALVIADGEVEERKPSRSVVILLAAARSALLRHRDEQLAMAWIRAAAIHANHGCPCAGIARCQYELRAEEALLHRAAELLQTASNTGDSDERAELVAFARLIVAEEV